MQQQALVAMDTGKWVTYHGRRCTVYEYCRHLDAKQAVRLSALVLRSRMIGSLTSSTLARKVWPLVLRVSLL